MNYFEESLKNYPISNSKSESIEILNKYKLCLTECEYNLILKSLCSLSLVGMFLNEKAILMSISQVKNEVSSFKILNVLKSA